MSILFSISLIYLVILFLLYKKTSKNLCIVSAIIYTIGLLFCYNTGIVFLLYLLRIKGSFLIYSIINSFIGTILLGIIIKTKQIQKYHLDKYKLGIILLVSLIIFIIGYFRFDGFKSINFESGDSAVHYRHALEFSEDLSILDKSNTNDRVFGSFVRVMPISYINCGFLFNIFSNVKTYTLFFIYNVVSLIICSLIFLISIIDISKLQKKDYLYSLILTLFYILAFPLNNFLIGFCYLSLSIMVINLLILTIFQFKDDFENNIIFKITTLTLLTFSCFCSYYLFVPAIYLALGIYYLILWKTKKLTFKQTLLYGTTTLIIPFIIGFCYFLITLFIDKGVDSVAKLINMKGYSYDNITSVYLFVLATAYILYDLIRKKSFNYLNLNIYTISLYIIIFLILLVTGNSDLYYFFKLFSVYWLLLILFLSKKLLSYKQIFYIISIVVIVINIPMLISNNNLKNLLQKTNIYSWNIDVLTDKNKVFTTEELDILEESMKYKNICEKNGKFLTLGNHQKNAWFYSITNSLPIIKEINGELNELGLYNINSFKAWTYNYEYECLIYFYENESVDLDKEKYNILYENSKGAIIKKLD